MFALARVKQDLLNRLQACGLASQERTQTYLPHLAHLGAGLRDMGPGTSNPQLAVRATEVEKVTNHGQHRYIVAIDVDASSPASQH